MALEIKVGPSGTTSDDTQSGASKPYYSKDDVRAISSEQWMRKLVVTVGSAGDLDLSDMHAEFMVRQSDGQHNNWALVRIFNLSKRTSDLGLLKEFDKFTIEAGYQQRSGPIFQGQVIQKRHGKLPNGVDRYFDILAESSSQAYGYSVVSKTLKAGWKYRDVVDEALKKLGEHGVQEGHITELGDKKGPRALVLHGNAKDILRWVAASTNTNWSIQEGNKLQMVKNDGFMPGEAKVLNADTGMIGLPEQNIKGIVVKCLIDPGMKVEGRVHIDEGSIQKALYEATKVNTVELQQAIMPEIAADGIYKIVRVDHDGEVEGTPWYTTLTCVAVGDRSLGGQQSELESKRAGDWKGNSVEEDNWSKITDDDFKAA